MQDSCWPSFDLPNERALAAFDRPPMHVEANPKRLARVLQDVTGDLSPTSGARHEIATFPRQVRERYRTYASEVSANLALAVSVHSFTMMSAAAAASLYPVGGRQLVEKDRFRAAAATQRAAISSRVLKSDRLPAIKRRAGGFLKLASRSAGSVAYRPRSLDAGS